MFIDMYRLRDMTVYLVQTIHAWRIELEEYTDQCQQHEEVVYYFEGQPFYEMVL